MWDMSQRCGPSGTLEIEWIIIDDGSTDKTKELVNKWIKENKIEIKYIYQKNSGKMSAINRGMEEVTGELVVDCDSDDYFAENAFKIISQNVKKLLTSKEIYALCFLKQNKQGNISGKKFKENFLKTTMFDLYFKDDIQGEKILVFNSKIRKKFKHELEGEEKFITEARMYHKMDKKYKILCINEAIEIGDYEDDGYTKNIRRTFYEAPKGYYKFFKEIFWKALFKANVKKKIYVVKHFILFWILKNKHKR